ncbi:hypothetical protein DOY81_012010, partial [Sarcophaga bullata]
FNHCRQNCERQNCSADGLEIQEQAIKYYRQTVFDKLLQWSCADECQYGCMWRTVDAFLDRGWPIPQFYGKWPFVRFFGMQEPASVIFSIFNIVAHLKNLRKFRKEVRPDSPCYKIWHIFTAVSLNAWIWSVVFHARDFPLTELLDYAFAYSMVLTTLYCMVMRYCLNKYAKNFEVLNCFYFRMLLKYSWILRALVSLMSFWLLYKLFCVYSVASLVSLALSDWFLWSFRNYLISHANYWILDAHALWHLATTFITSLLYSFAIDDCQMLRKEKYYELGAFNKEI